MQRRNSRGRELELETASATANPVSKPTETIEQKHNEQHYSSGQPALVSAEEDQTIQNSDERKYLTGWRLHCLSAALVDLQL
jgi:hypothetical protein